VLDRRVEPNPGYAVPVPSPEGPAWADDLFPVPTPAAFRPMVDAAWRHATQDGYYDWIEFVTQPNLFDLTVFPRAPEGWECSPEIGGTRVPEVVFYGVPEFVAFGLNGCGGAYGWLVPAPELDRSDHPVGFIDGHQPGFVAFLGPDTRAGLQFITDLVGTSPWDDDDSRYDPVIFDVPPGWRHQAGAHGIGVLAPAEAFADRPATVPTSSENAALMPVLANAARFLDTGHPASALLCVENAFVELPSCCFAELRPLWAQAYLDLDRARYVEYLEAMAPVYDEGPCLCDTHRGAD
jgi:hypothetical protein